MIAIPALRFAIFRNVSGFNSAVYGGAITPLSKPKLNVLDDDLSQRLLSSAGKFCSTSRIRFAELSGVFNSRDESLVQMKGKTGHLPADSLEQMSLFLNG